MDAPIACLFQLGHHRRRTTERHVKPPGRDDAVRDLSKDKMSRPLAGLMTFLVLGLGLNLFLLSRMFTQSDPGTSAQSGGHLEDVRQQSHDLKANGTNDGDPFLAKGHELLQLRNQVGELRRQATQAAGEIGRLRAQLDEVGRALVQTQNELAEATKRAPEEWQQMLKDEQSARCANHLKQICMAARIWAEDHNHVFPSDLVSMEQELSGPEVLFCPADTAAICTTEWPLPNPSLITYRFLNPGGSAEDSTNLLVICPIHGHFGLSDGSVSRNRAQGL